MKKPNLCALIYGKSLSHLDHLAPMCSLLDIPLVVTEESLQIAAQKSYIDLIVHLYDYEDAAIQVVKNFDIVISSLPSPTFQSIFMVAEHLVRKKLLNIWCPHGNSDKGENTYFFEALSEETVALCYGTQMIEKLKRKNVFGSINLILEIGNYRYLHYKKMKPFFDKLLQSYFKSLNPKNQKVLYAPTWREEENSTLLSDLEVLIKNLPENMDLIIKLHPNTLIQKEHELLSIYAKYESYPNIVFLSDFPSIYPILDSIDIYLGDTSSIGYDFLVFDKPMFFLNTDNTPLSKAGITVSIKDPKIFDQIKGYFPDSTLSANRKKLYEEAFNKDASLDNLLQEILSFYATYKEANSDIF